MNHHSMLMECSLVTRLGPRRVFREQSSKHLPWGAQALRVSAHLGRQRLLLDPLDDKHPFHTTGMSHKCGLVSNRNTLHMPLCSVCGCPHKDTSSVQQVISILQMVIHSHGPFRPHTRYFGGFVNYSAGYSC